MNLEDQRYAVLSSLYLSYSQVTLHVSGVSRNHHLECTNCSYNHLYKSCCKLQRYHLDRNCGLENWFKLLTCNFAHVVQGCLENGLNKISQKVLTIGRCNDKIRLIRVRERAAISLGHGQIRTGLSGSYGDYWSVYERVVTSVLVSIANWNSGFGSPLDYSSMRLALWWRV